MIDDDTIIAPLSWRPYERSGESHKIANEKCNAILGYVFPDYTDKGFFFDKDGIRIEKWSLVYDYEGIKMEFYDSFKRKTQWRTVKFQGTAQTFKTKVLEKFETLKTQKIEADKKANIRQVEERATSDEIDELQRMANEKYNPLGINTVIDKTFGGSYRLTLRMDFDTKQELIDYINNF